MCVAVVLVTGSDAVPSWLDQQPSERAAFLADVAEAYYQSGGQYDDLEDEGAVAASVDRALTAGGWTIRHTGGLPDVGRSAGDGRGSSIDEPPAVDLPERDDV